MAKKRETTRKANVPTGPGGPYNSATGQSRNLTETDIRRALQGSTTRINRSVNRRINQQLPALIRDTVQTTISSVIENGWLGPQQPVAPVGIPSIEPDVRTWEYTPGYNVNWQPRKYQPYSFAQLLWIAQNFDGMAQVIERRKNEVMTASWELTDDENEVSQEEQDRIHAALEFPDRIHPFNTWLRMWLHAMYTIDAACIHMRRTISGDVYSLDVIAGETITPLIGQDGNPPEPPDPAYLQVIYGTPYSLLTRPDGQLAALDDKGNEIPSATATRNELLYCPRNPRPGQPLYGFSQVEQCVMTIAIALKLEQASLAYWTKGNIPESLVSVPESWSPRQVASFQVAFDSMLRGNIDRRVGSMIFVPGGTKAAELKEHPFNREQYEWVMRMVCASLNVSPQPYIQMQNRATAQTASVMQAQEGLQPDMVFVQDVMNRILRDGYHTKLKFSYKSDTQYDPDKQAQADHIDVTTGVKAISEVREDRGLEAYDNGLGTKPFVVVGNTVMLLEDIEAQSKASIQEAQGRASIAANPPPPPAAFANGKPTNGQPAANGKPANGKPSQANASPSANSNGNGSKPQSQQSAEKLLDYGGAQKLVKRDGQRWLDAGDYLVPLKSPEGRPLL